MSCKLKVLLTSIIVMIISHATIISYCYYFSNATNNGIVITMIVAIATIKVMSIVFVFVLLSFLPAY